MASRLFALDGAEGTGSSRSIPGVDLLGGLTAGARHLGRDGRGCGRAVPQAPGGTAR